MSLILEALRKSEAERRLGSAPDLLRAMPVMRASAPRSRWPLAAACVAVLLAMFALGWWWTFDKASPRPPGARIAAQQTQPAPDSRIGDSALRNTSTSPDAAQFPRAPAIPRAVAQASLANAPVQAAMPPVPHAEAAAAAPAILPVRQVPAPIPAAVAPAPAMPVAPAPTDEPALLSLADLGADERNGLPALKVSMHVYADDPARRFMIIDGQRVGEGALLADGVVLVRIRRDGAELDVRGRRVLLPKP